MLQYIDDDDDDDDDDDLWLNTPAAVPTLYASTDGNSEFRTMSSKEMAVM
jgi:hypothetical protein